MVILYDPHASEILTEPDFIRAGAKEAFIYPRLGSDSETIADWGIADVTTNLKETEISSTIHAKKNLPPDITKISWGVLETAHCLRAAVSHYISNAFMRIYGPMQQAETKGNNLQPYKEKITEALKRLKMLFGNIQNYSLGESPDKEVLVEKYLDVGNIIRLDPASELPLLSPIEENVWIQARDHLINTEKMQRLHSHIEGIEAALDRNDFEAYKLNIIGFNNILVDVGRYFSRIEPPSPTGSQLGTGVKSSSAGEILKGILEQVGADEEFKQEVMERGSTSEWIAELLQNEKRRELILERIAAIWNLRKEGMKFPIRLWMFRFNADTLSRRIRILAGRVPVTLGNFRDLHSIDKEENRKSEGNIDLSKVSPDIAKSKDTPLFNALFPGEGLNELTRRLKETERELATVREELEQIRREKARQQEELARANAIIKELREKLQEASQKARVESDRKPPPEVVEPAEAKPDYKEQFGQLVELFRKKESDGKIDARAAKLLANVIRNTDIPKFDWYPHQREGARGLFDEKFIWIGCSGGKTLTDALAKIKQLAKAEAERLNIRSMTLAPSDDVVEQNAKGTAKYLSQLGINVIILKQNPKGGYPLAFIYDENYRAKSAEEMDKWRPIRFEEACKIERAVFHARPDIVVFQWAIEQLMSTVEERIFTGSRKGRPNFDESDLTLEHELANGFKLQVPVDEKDPRYKKLKEQNTQRWQISNEIAKGLLERKDASSLFKVDGKSAILTKEGQKEVIKLLDDAELSGIEPIEWQMNVEKSLTAHLCYNKGERKGSDYDTIDEKIVLRDEATARLLHGKRLEQGMHCALEAKEGVEINLDGEALISVSILDFLYSDFVNGHFSGMTGTPNSKFNKDIYNKETLEIERERREWLSAKKDYEELKQELPRISVNEATKWQEVVSYIAEELPRDEETGRIAPAYIYVEDSKIDEFEERLETELKGMKDSGEITKIQSIRSRSDLTEEQNTAENEKAKQEGGKLGVITLVTKTGGRGIDLRITESEEGDIVRELGGITAISTCIDELYVFEEQFKRRVARDRDPGRFVAFWSLDDKLLNDYIRDYLPEHEADMRRLAKRMSDLKLRLETRERLKKEATSIIAKLRDKIAERRILSAQQQMEFSKMTSEHLKQFLEEREKHLGDEKGLGLLDAAWRSYQTRADRIKDFLMRQQRYYREYEQINQMSLITEYKDLANRIFDDEFDKLIKEKKKAKIEIGKEKEQPEAGKKPEGLTNLIVWAANLLPIAAIVFGSVWAVRWLFGLFGLKSIGALFTGAAVAESPLAGLLTAGIFASMSPLTLSILVFAGVAFVAGWFVLGKIQKRLAQEQAQEELRQELRRVSGLKWTQWARWKAILRSPVTNLLSVGAYLPVLAAVTIFSLLTLVTVSAPAAALSITAIAAVSGAGFLSRVLIIAINWKFIKGRSGHITAKQRVFRTAVAGALVTLTAFLIPAILLEAVGMSAVAASIGIVLLLWYISIRLSSAIERNVYSPQKIFDDGSVSKLPTTTRSSLYRVVAGFALGSIGILLLSFIPAPVVISLIPILGAIVTSVFIAQGIYFVIAEGKQRLLLRQPRSAAIGEKGLEAMTTKASIENLVINMRTVFFAVVSLTGMLVAAASIFTGLIPVAISTLMAGVTIGTVAILVLLGAHNAIERASYRLALFKKPSRRLQAHLEKVSKEKPEINKDNNILEAVRKYKAERADVNNRGLYSLALAQMEDSNNPILQQLKHQIEENSPPEKDGYRYSRAHAYQVARAAVDTNNLTKSLPEPLKKELTDTLLSVMSDMNLISTNMYLLSRVLSDPKKILKGMQYTTGAAIALPFTAAAPTINYYTTTLYMVNKESLQQEATVSSPADYAKALGATIASVFKSEEAKPTTSEEKPRAPTKQKKAPLREVPEETRELLRGIGETAEVLHEGIPTYQESMRDPSEPPASAFEPTGLATYLKSSAIAIDEAIVTPEEAQRLEELRKLREEKQAVDEQIRRLPWNKEDLIAAIEELAISSIEYPEYREQLKAQIKELMMPFLERPTQNDISNFERQIDEFTRSLLLERPDIEEWLREKLEPRIKELTASLPELPNDLEQVRNLGRLQNRSERLQIEIEPANGRLVVPSAAKDIVPGITTPIHNNIENLKEEIGQLQRQKEIDPKTEERIQHLQAILRIINKLLAPEATITLSSIEEAAGEEGFFDDEKDKAVDEILSYITAVEPQIIRIIYDLIKEVDEGYAESFILERVLNPKALDNAFKKILCLFDLREKYDEETLRSSRAYNIYQTVQQIITDYLMQRPKAEIPELDKSREEQARREFERLREKVNTEMAGRNSFCIYNPEAYLEITDSEETNIKAGLFTEFEFGSDQIDPELIRDYRDAFSEYYSIIIEGRVSMLVPYLYYARMEENAKEQIQGLKTIADGLTTEDPEQQFVKIRIQLLINYLQRYTDIKRQYLTRLEEQGIVPKDIQQHLKSLENALFGKSAPPQDIIAIFEPEIDALPISGILNPDEKSFLEGLRGSFGLGFDLTDSQDPVSQIRSFLRFSYPIYDSTDRINRQLQDIYLAEAGERFAEEVTRRESEISEWENQTRKARGELDIVDEGIATNLEMLETTAVSESFDISEALSTLNNLEQQCRSIPGFYQGYEFNEETYQGLLSSVIQTTLLRFQVRNLLDNQKEWTEATQPLTREEKKEIKVKQAEFNKKFEDLRNNIAETRNLSQLSGHIDQVRRLAREYRRYYIGKSRIEFDNKIDDIIYGSDNNDINGRALYLLEKRLPLTKDIAEQLSVFLQNMRYYALEKSAQQEIFRDWQNSLVKAFDRLGIEPARVSGDYGLEGGTRRDRRNLNSMTQKLLMIQSIVERAPPKAPAVGDVVTYISSTFSRFHQQADCINELYGYEGKINRADSLKTLNDVIENLSAFIKEDARYFISNEEREIFERKLESLEDAVEEKARSIIKEHAIINDDFIKEFTRFFKNMQYSELNPDQQKQEAKDWKDIIEDEKLISRTEDSGITADEIARKQQILGSIITDVFKDVHKQREFNELYSHRDREHPEENGVIQRLDNAETLKEVTDILVELNDLEKKYSQHFRRRIINFRDKIQKARVRAHKKYLSIIRELVDDKKFTIDSNFAEQIASYLKVISYDRFSLEEQSRAYKNWQGLLDDIVEKDTRLNSSRKDILPKGRPTHLHIARIASISKETHPSFSATVEGLNRAFVDFLPTYIIRQGLKLDETTNFLLVDFISSVGLSTLPSNVRVGIQHALISEVVQMAERTKPLRGFLRETKEKLQETPGFIGRLPTDRELLDGLILRAEKNEDLKGSDALKNLKAFLQNLDSIFKEAKDKAAAEGVTGERPAESLALAKAELEFVLNQFDRTLTSIEQAIEDITPDVDISNIIDGTLAEDILTQMIITERSLQMSLPRLLIRAGREDENYFATIAKYREKLKEIRASLKDYLTKAVLENTEADLGQKINAFGYLTIDLSQAGVHLNTEEIIDLRNKIMAQVKSARDANIITQEEAKRMLDDELDRLRFNDAIANRKQYIKQRIDSLISEITAQTPEHGVDEIELLLEDLYTEAKEQRYMTDDEINAKRGEVETAKNNAKTEREKSIGEFNRIFAAQIEQLNPISNFEQLAQAWLIICNLTLDNITLFDEAGRERIVQTAREAFEKYDYAIRERENGQRQFNAGLLQIRQDLPLIESDKRFLENIKEISERVKALQDYARYFENSP
ncbi:MAG: hypothetical protein JSW18_00190, partial [Candidatus Omnitrophota bacterium]